MTSTIFEMDSVSPKPLQGKLEPLQQQILLQVLLIQNLIINQVYGLQLLIKRIFEHTVPKSVTTYSRMVILIICE